MKKIFLSLAMVLTLTTVFTSCRDTKKDNMELKADDNDDVEDAVDDAADDVEDALDDAGDAIEEGVDEIKENTGMGGTDDN